MNKWTEWRDEIQTPVRVRIYEAKEGFELQVDLRGEIRVLLYVSGNKVTLNESMMKDLGLIKGGMSA